MTDKKPGLIEAAERFRDNFYRFVESVDSGKWDPRKEIRSIELEDALAHAKKREALVEAVVRESRRQLWSDFKSCNRDCGHKDCDLLRALAALDRFDAGEGR